MDGTPGGRCIYMVEQFRSPNPPSSNGTRHVLARGFEQAWLLTKAAAAAAAVGTSTSVLLEMSRVLSERNDGDDSISSGSRELVARERASHSLGTRRVSALCGVVPRLHAPGAVGVGLRRLWLLGDFGGRPSCGAMHGRWLSGVRSGFRLRSGCFELLGELFQLVEEAAHWQVDLNAAAATAAGGRVRDQSGRRR